MQLSKEPPYRQHSALGLSGKETANRHCRDGRRFQRQCATASYPWQAWTAVKTFAKGVGTCRGGAKPQAVDGTGGGRRSSLIRTRSANGFLARGPRPVQAQARAPFDLGDDTARLRRACDLIGEVRVGASAGGRNRAGEGHRSIRAPGLAQLPTLNQHKAFVILDKTRLHARNQ